MAETDPNRLIPHQGEILPPKKHTDWYATTTDYIRRPAVRWVGSLSLLGFAGYCASQFVQLRGIVNIPASRIFLYVGAIALTLLAWGIVSNLPRFRKTAAVSLALIIWIAALVIDMKSVPKSGTDKAGGVVLGGTLTVAGNLSQPTSAAQTSSPPDKTIPQEKQKPSQHKGKSVIKPEPLSPPATYEQKCEGSACAQGPGAQATYNQYGATNPPPNPIGLKIHEVNPARRGVDTVETSPARYNPGSLAFFTVDRQFDIPIFTITCDRPCVATSADIDFKIPMGPRYLTTNDPNVVRIVLGTMGPLTTDIPVKLWVRSIDSEKVSVTNVKGYIQPVPKPEEKR